MLKWHKPPIVGLLETRVASSQAEKIMAQTNLTNIIAEANGFAGAILFLWDHHIVQIEEISKHDRILNTDEASNKFPWVVAGDVNQALDVSDKMGRHPIN